MNLTHTWSATADLVVTNALGQRVMEQVLPTADGPVRVSLQDYPPGLYFLTLRAADRQAMVRILKGL